MPTAYGNFSEDLKMLKHIPLNIILIILVLLVVPAFGEIIYVDADAAGANNGSSWADAYNYLQDALMAALAGDEIRVAQGTYKPNEFVLSDRPNQGRRETFQLKNGVAIRGGYAGFSEPEPDARHIDIYETILSGDLDGNDGPDFANNDDNSLNVVTGIGTDETAGLDGFTITGARRCGMNNDDCNPILSNCKFKANRYEGMQNTRSGPILTNCTFENNGRSGMENRECNLTLTNCIFKGNSRSAIDQILGSLTLTGCLFSDNSGFFGGAIDSFSGYLTLYNCTFIRNRADATGGAIHTSSDILRLRNCTFSNNSAGSRGGGVSAHVTDGDCEIENCVFSGNKAENGAAMQIWAGPLTISNCVFAGNMAEEKAGALYCRRDYVTVRNCTFFSNAAGVEGSAVYATDKLKVTNSIFRDNTPDEITMSRDNPEVTVSFCDIQTNWPGRGNINVDPFFAEPGYWDENATPEDLNDDLWVDGDYHLLSQAGRWDPDSQRWIQDDITSPCIDAGDPNSLLGTEPFPNGGRPNMGAYGASDKASKSYFGWTVCETIVAGDINGDCVVDFADIAIVLSHWMMRGEDFVNQPPTVRLIEPQDGARIKWPGPTTFRAEAEDVDGQVLSVSFKFEYKSENFTTGHGLTDRDGTDGWQREYTWRGDITEGNWTVWAEATDNEGAVGTSPEIVITLYRD
jgi:predicted outer membrane repeat protein